MSAPLVLKLGGELLESGEQRARVAACVAAEMARRPVVVIHGGGRAVDVELGRRGIAPRKVDGLRVTDAGTLDAVVAVLAGSANTELVAALVGRSVPAVGLTGVDAGFGRAARTRSWRAASGELVDLGLVGDPVEPDTSLVELLLVHGYVPVIASLGIEADGTPTTGTTVLNVNADVMACRIAGGLPGCALVIAGATAGVLDAGGETIAALDPQGIDDLVARGTATAGMVAKLSACRHALEDGVATVRIVDGRHFDADYGVDAAPGTTLAARSFSEVR